MIDDFSTPQGPLVTGDTEAVSGPGIVGDWRHVGAGNHFVVTDGEATFSTLCCDNVMSVSYLGATGTGFAPVDLTDGGIATHFLVGVSDLVGGASLGLIVNDADGDFFSMSIPLLTPGVHSAPIPNGLADVTQVDKVLTGWFISPVPPIGASVSIDFFCTGTLEGGCTTPVTSVPEPGTGITLAVLIAILPLLRRRFTPASTATP